MTRREFVRNAGLAVAYGMIGRSGLARANHPSDKPKVVLVRDKNAVDLNGAVNGRVLASMLDDAVTELLGQPNAAAAWRCLIQPNDVVGIKTSRWRFLPTPEPLETAIKTRMIAAGVSEHAVAIDDYGAPDNPIFQHSTALINIRPVRTHYWSGLGGCVRNYLRFADFSAEPSAAWDLPIVKNKTRLNILVMFTPLFHGATPQDVQNEYSWNYGGLLAGFDPVAIDATGWQIIQAKRQQLFGTANKPPEYLARALSDKTDVCKRGWFQDALI